MGAWDNKDSDSGGGAWGGGSSSSKKKKKRKKKDKPKKQWYDKPLDAAAGFLGGMAQVGKSAVDDAVTETKKLWEEPGEYLSHVANPMQAAIDWYKDEDDEYEADDIAKAIVKSYEDKYAKPFEEHDGMAAWAQLGTNMANDPVGSVLDVLTVASAFFTAGGSLAVRGVTLSGKAGKVAQGVSATEKSERLTRIAKTQGVKSKGLAAEIAKEEAQAAAALGRKGPIDAAMSGQGGRTIITKGGDVYVPKRGKLILPGGQVAHTVPLASSPYRRVMQQAGLSVSNKAPSVMLIGSSARSSKLDKRVETITAGNELGRVMGDAGGATSTRKAQKKMGEEENFANYVRTVTGETGKAHVPAAAATEKLEGIADFYKVEQGKVAKAAEGGDDTVQYDRIVEEARKSTQTAEGRLKKQGHLEADDRLDVTQMASAVRDAANNHSGLLKAEKQKLAQVAAKVDEDKAALASGAKGRTAHYTRDVMAGPVNARMDFVKQGGEEASKQINFKERLAKNEKSLAALQTKVKRMEAKQRAYRQVVKDLSRGSARFERKATEVNQLAKVVKDPKYAEQVMQSLQARHELALSDDVAKVFMNPTKVMLRVEKAQGEAAKYTTHFIKDDLGVKVREERPYLLAEMALGRKLTPEELAAVTVRPHTAVKPRSRGTRNKEWGKRKPSTKPSLQTGSSKYMSTYNFRFAQDSVKPAAVFKVWNESRAFKAKMRVLQRVKDVGFHPTADDLADPEFLKTFEVVGGDSKLANYAARLQEKLDGELRVIIGKNATLDEVSSYVKELVAKTVDESQQWAVPKVYYKHLTEELRRSDKFVARLVDTPTAVFRAATLNLRPAWIVNNFVGQLTLLMMSQGVLHGTREYMGEVGRAVASKAGKRTATGRALDKHAGAIKHAEVGMASEMAETQAALGRAVGVGWLVDWPGFRRPKDEAGKPEGSLAAHTAAIALKAIPSTAKGLSDAMGRINQILTDDIPRRAAFMAEARPIIERVQRVNPKIGVEEAMEMVMRDERTAAKLIDKTMGDLIDYSRLSQGEREIVRRLVPFYSWIKGSTFRAGRLVRDTPERAAAAYAVGDNYAEGAEERFGVQMPGSMVGAIDLGGGDIMPTAGLNIFQTPADLASLALSGFERGGLAPGPDHPMSFINPVVKAPMEQFFGVDPFSGSNLYAKKGKQGPYDLLDPGVKDNPYTDTVDEGRTAFGSTASRYLASLGPLNLYMRYKQSADGDQNTKMLPRTTNQIIASYLGYNVAGLNEEKANDIATSHPEYAMLRYDQTEGEFPLVMGRERTKKKSESKGAWG